MKPANQTDWAAVLDGIEALQKSWPELQKAHEDYRDFGYGFLRITADGFQHLPASRVRIDIGDPPSTYGPVIGAGDTDSQSDAAAKSKG
jgi:hypothetical protein